MIIVRVVLTILALSSASSVSAVTAPDLDDTVHILAAKEPGVSQNLVNSRMNQVLLAWSNTGFNNDAAPASVSIINPGAALSTVVDFTGSEDDQIEKAKIYVSTPVANNPSLRDTLAADVVVVFVDQLTVLGLPACGYAPQFNWLEPNNEYIPDSTTQLDLRGADDNGGTDGYYVALVSVQAPCHGGLYRDTAIHELGHLFGAGHLHSLFGGQPGLYSHSRPYIYDMHWPSVGTWTFRTIMGLPTDPECTQTNGSCYPRPRFSDNYYNVITHKNSAAIDTTAVSVANYRAGDPVLGYTDTCLDGMDNDGDGDTDMQDGDCQLGSERPPPPAPPSLCDSSTGPYGVIAFLVHQCAPGPPPGTSSPSEYRIVWEHPCPEHVAFYEVWSEIPPGAPPFFEWISPSHTTDGLIDGGGSARVLIKSCGLAGCSSLVGGPIVVDIC